MPKSFHLFKLSCMFRHAIIFYFLFFTFTSCRYNVKEAMDCKKSDTISITNSNKISNFKLISSEKPLVNKYKAGENESINYLKSDLNINNLRLEFSNGYYFITAEISNNTNDTIFQSNDTFLYHNEETNSWCSLPYPENFVKEDLGTFITPNTKQHNKFFFPIHNHKLQGKYKLQLSFYTNLGTIHYNISQIFIIR